MVPRRTRPAFEEVDASEDADRCVENVAAGEEAAVVRRQGRGLPNQVYDHLPLDALFWLLVFRGRPPSNLQGCGRIDLDRGGPIEIAGPSERNGSYRLTKGAEQGKGAVGGSRDAVRADVERRLARPSLDLAIGVAPK